MAPHMPNRRDRSEGRSHVIPGEIVETGLVDANARSYDPSASATDQAYTPVPLGPGQHQQQSVVAAHSMPAYDQAPPMPLPPLPEKSVGLAFLLTFLFGPVGMFYSTVSGALILLAISLVVSVCAALVIALITLATFGLGAALGFLAPLMGVPVWITAMIWGCLAASSHNERMRSQYAQHAQAYAQYGATYAYQSMQHAAAPGHGTPRY